VVVLWAVWCAIAAFGCNGQVRDSRYPGEDLHRLPPAQVNEPSFAGSVHRLLRDGEHTPERSALLAGVVRRQLAHAATLFARGETTRGTNAVVGALYLVRIGEVRRDMFEPKSVAALRGAMERFSARGDEGRATALMLMLQKLLPRNSEEYRAIGLHLQALERWVKDTRNGGDMARLAADERAAVNRALVEPSEVTIEAAARAIDRWVQRAIRYNMDYQRTGKLPPRDEVVEAYRALQTGGETMAALFLRHGRAKDALTRVERSSAHRVTNPAFFARLRAAAIDDSAEDWRLLARDLARVSFEGDSDVRIDEALLDAALWGIAVESYRRDPSSLAIGHLIAAQLVELGMPEVAPLVLNDALGKDPAVVSLSAVTSMIADILSEQYEASNIATARRVFAASAPVLKIADGRQYRGKLKPSAAQLRQLMASLELRVSNADRARRLLMRALKDEPTVWGYTMLATLERQLGDLDSALADAMRAVGLPSARVLELDAADAQLLAFEILRDKGNKQRAEHALEQALQIVLSSRKQRNTPEARIRAERILARVLDSYGDRQRANRALQRALDIAGNHRQMLGATLLAAVGRALVHRDVSAARAAVQVGIKGDVDKSDLVYAAMWLMLLEKELNESPDGKVERVLLDAIQGDGWTSKLAQWGRGMITDDRLRTIASSHAERIEAEFYIVMRERAGGASGANEKLRDIAKHPLIDLMEVQIARDLLAPKLDAKLPPKYEVP
jgi:tetratricopeptide (TPR) repeat protein